MKSIIQDEKKCYFCENPNVQDHHIFNNNPCRRLSEKYGLKVWLCPAHHRLVHEDVDLRISLKRMGQEVFESRYGSREDFRQIFGKNYLGDKQ